MPIAGCSALGQDLRGLTAERLPTLLLPVLDFLKTRAADGEPPRFRVPTRQGFRGLVPLRARVSSAAGKVRAPVTVAPQDSVGAAVDKMLQARSFAASFPVICVSSCLAVADVGALLAICLFCAGEGAPRVGRDQAR